MCCKCSYLQLAPGFYGLEQATGCFHIWLTTSINLSSRHWSWSASIQVVASHHWYWILWRSRQQLRVLPSRLLEVPHVLHCLPWLCGAACSFFHCKIMGIDDTVSSWQGQYAGVHPVDACQPFLLKVRQMLQGMLSSFCAAWQSWNAKFQTALRAH